MENTANKTLLSRIREAMGLTQRDMANVLGKSFSAIRQYESGARRITPQVLSLLMTFCIGNGLIDLAREVEELAMGPESRKLPPRPKWQLPADSHLHAMLERLIQMGDTETIQHASAYLQMSIFWLNSPVSRDLRSRIDALHAGSTVSE